MSEETNKSAVAAYAEIEHKMHIAFTTDLRFIAQITPFIEQRRIAAERYFHNKPVLGETESQQLIELVKYCNEKIKEIMGL